MVADHEAEPDHEANLGPAPETEPAVEMDPTLPSDPLYLYFNSNINSFFWVNICTLFLEFVCTN